jgi:hypothetical protein
MRFQSLAPGTPPAQHRAMPAAATATHRARLFALVAGAAVLLGALALGGGCGLFGRHDAEAQSDDDGYGLEPPNGPECVVDTDCVAAASSCCECPAFALPVSSGWDDSCEDVLCPREPDDPCDSVAPACQEGTCTLACVPVVCEQVCDGGFAVDAAGCLVCECGGGAPIAECVVDADCAQVPGDCCGCARGGVDTAVPASDIDGFADQLDCSTDEAEACPDVDVCDAESVPRCLGGSCTLAAAPSEDADAGLPPPASDVLPCGTTAYPPCPEGFVCTLNDPAANENGLDGVGVCVDQDG